jgi:radical SAM enzyme (TIGR01210 family)
MTNDTVGWTLPKDGTESVLDRAILSIRSERPRVDARLPFIVYSRGDYIQIWINTPACRFSLSGKCSICDYWDGENSQDAIDLVCRYIKEHGNDYSTLLINTCGSCFCEEELPFPELLRVARAISNTSVKCIVFESHLVYVRLDNLKTLINILRDKELVVEYGQESTSPAVLKYCLNKPSMLHEYKILQELHALGVKIFVNVVLGSPFLSVRQRIQDTVDSIRSLLNNTVDGIVLFPVNIKPYTLIKYLFDNGYYVRVNAIEIVKVLENFTKNELAKIELAWFEPQREVQAAYTERGLNPLYCEHCGKKVLEAFYKYCQEEDGASREVCIRQLQEMTCECFDTIYHDSTPDINKCYEFLEKSFPQGGVYAAN